MKFFFILTFLLSIVSCSTMKTSETGLKVKPVTALEKEKYGCQFLDIVTGSFGSGWSGTENNESVIADTRNKVANLGGNGFLILMTDRSTWPESTLSINAEALKCNFK